MPWNNREFHEPGEAIRLMAAAGLQATMPRLAVWMVLAHSDTPMLATDIHRRLLSKGASASLSSVYQSLKRLTSAGLVSVQAFEGDKAHYTLMSRRLHHRIVCEVSGKEHWVADADLNRVITQFCQAQGFDLCDYTLSIQARQVTDVLPQGGATRRTRRPTHSKGDRFLRQGDSNHENEVPTVLPDTG